MAYPSSYKYTREHEWLQVDGKTASVGLTDFAQKELGDIVFVELPEVGKVFQAEEAFGTVESVKAVSELYAPVSGKVTATNTDLSDDPELINEDANSTWLIKIQMSDTKELDGLLSADQYQAYIAQES
ncbi:glycine cleavage system protein GcvH [Streptacidiphilus sp. 4-A2]|nr:glycine cleavage system protein GcvH [Streptacidiphilus sp. 4-A2]